MPSPLEMLIQAHQGGNMAQGSPVAQGDATMMRKQMEEQRKQEMEQQAMGKFQQTLMQRLNPRIGTKEDSDPQFNPMLQLMMKLRGGMGAPNGNLQ